MNTRRTRWTVTFTLCCALMAVGSPAGAQLLSSEELRPLFAKTDQNRDGTVGRAEFHRWSVKRFYFFDKDRKGYLVPEDIKGLTTGEFKVANRKGDGNLTLDEFLDARLLQFDLADTNGDGVLTLYEFETYMNRMR